jgi:hypothetical protein
MAIYRYKPQQIRTHLPGDLERGRYPHKKPHIAIDVYSASTRMGKSAGSVLYLTKHVFPTYFALSALYSPRSSANCKAGALTS